MKRRLAGLTVFVGLLSLTSFTTNAQGPPVGNIGGAGLGSTIPEFGQPPQVPVFMGAAKVPLPEKVWAQDLPNDNGTGLVLLWRAFPEETSELTYTIYIAENETGPWLRVKSFPADTSYREEYGQYFPGYFWFRKHREPKTWHAVAVVDVKTDEPKDPTKPEGERRVIPEKNKRYYLKLTASLGGAQAEYPEILQATARENWFHTARSNNLIFAVLFGTIILYFIARARKDPNLYIRKIAGLEAVDEAIGRATEMGKPILYINGLETLSHLATLASLNVLGRVARRVANYESQVTVPCRDPVVLSVAQEIVKQGYMDAGRPDAYNEDNIFFLTEDQFSYAAAVCGIMMRDKPAANFFMGHYYAEGLILAETGASTGAIQIAGTDATTQLPFFVTTCDYTLIGEELYAASAYLAREPMLLGSIKGQDVGKLFMMIVILLGTILVTMNIPFIRDLFKALG